MPMNRKSLSALIALALGTATTVQAQDYDDRWYFAPYLGYYNNDDDRLTDDGSLLIGGGIGRYVAPNASIEAFIDRTSRSFNNDEACALLDLCSNASDFQIGVAGRFFFGPQDGFAPFLMAGLMANNHRGGVEDGWGPAAQLGGGLQTSMTENVKFRAEAGYRYIWDDETIPSEDNYGDWFVNLGVVMMIGELPAAPPPPPPPPPAPVVDCSTLDDDKDGVNNCDDKCPASAPGEGVGPDGCPQEVVIDLRGVEFYFDRPRPGQETSVDTAGLLPGSMDILAQAVDVLKRYPNMRVEVAGHTDSIGTEEYNQSLSERRSKVVYDYLVSNGVDAGRLVGPVGFGETKPIDTNDTKEGRQRNRRTELSTQR
jgi:OmpA-OmpF porin, OOP family